LSCDLRQKKEKSLFRPAATHPFSISTAANSGEQVRDTLVNFLINAARFKKCFQSAAINFYDCSCAPAAPSKQPEPTLRDILLSPVHLFSSVE
jgi:hypothetical protein